jgi:hypothetical protein
MNLQDTGNPELDVDPEKCPVNAMLDRLIQRRITEALDSVFSNIYINASGTPMISTDKDREALRRFLREGWNP